MDGIANHFSVQNVLVRRILRTRSQKIFQRVLPPDSRTSAPRCLDLDINFLASVPIVPVLRNGHWYVILSTLYSCSRHLVGQVRFSSVTSQLQLYIHYTGWPPKSKLPPIKKIVLKIANEIRFLRKVKYESSTIIQSVGNKYSVRDLLL